MKEDTFPKLLERNYRKYGNAKVALRRKDFGFWKEYSWTDYYEMVKYLCLGLVERGLCSNDKVAIIGDNDPEWYWGELAALSAKCQVVGLYSDAIPSEIRYILEHSESSIVIAHDQEQVDKILGLIKESEQLTKNIKLVVYWDPKGLGSYNVPILANFYYVVEQGKKYEQEHPGIYTKMVEDGSANDIAILCYTSGTKSLPKGAIISHKNLIFSAERFSIVVRIQDKHNILSYVSPAWIAEQTAGIGMQLVSGVMVNFGEKPETQAYDIREIGPDMIFYGPRLWESMVSSIQVKVEDADFVKRFFYNLFLPVGYKKADIYFARKKMNVFWNILYKISFWLVFRPLTDKLGLLRAKACMTGGAPLSPDTFRFLNGIGINLINTYGLTEGTPLTSHFFGDIKFESIGQPVKDVEIRITDEEEIIARGDHIFQGYFKDEEATRKTIINGWLHTGDCGRLDDEGHLIFYDRMTDMAELITKEKFAPQYIEGRLRFSPYIKDVMVIGNKKDFVAAIINIDYEVVGKWAERKHIAFTTFTDLSQKDEVYELIDKEITKVNKTLPAAVRVKRYFNFYKEFDPDEAELTRTRKLRRGFMEERYGNLIQAMYDGKKDIMTETVITYQDGRKATISTNVKFRTLGEVNK